MDILPDSILQPFNLFFYSENSSTQIILSKCFQANDFQIAIFSLNLSRELQSHISNCRWTFTPEEFMSEQNAGHTKMGLLGENSQLRYREKALNSDLEEVSLSR